MHTHIHAHTRTYDTTHALDNLAHAYTEIDATAAHKGVLPELTRRQLTCPANLKAPVRRVQPLQALAAAFMGAVRE